MLANTNHKLTNSAETKKNKNKQETIILKWNKQKSIDDSSPEIQGPEFHLDFWRERIQVVTK